MLENEVILEVKGLSKRFGPINALTDVDFILKRGEIRGLVGENGSGKSTLTSIIAGMQKQTSGEVIFLGQFWNPKSMMDAQYKGISMILQEANTVPDCSVAENLFAGRENRFKQFGLLNMSKMIKAADVMLEKYGLSQFKGKDPINRFNYEERKLIEMVRCVHEFTEILIIDETSTALSHEGRVFMYHLMDQMIAQNKAVIFISHDLDEIMSRCTDITVLRDGLIRGDMHNNPIEKQYLVEDIRSKMVGRNIGANLFPEREHIKTGEVKLALSGISCIKIKDFNLLVRAGEVVGIGGLSGSGMHEIGRICFGLDSYNGHVQCKGKRILSPQVAVANGMAYISKNRDLESIIIEDTVEKNLVYPVLIDFSKKIIISPNKEKLAAEKQIKNLNIKCFNGHQKVRTLSGGNKQKVAFGKWLAKGSEIFIMDCPTRGVDIGVKQAMYQIIHEMKKQQKAVLMISEELSELIGIADRIVVMKDFKVAKEFDNPSELNELDLVEYMI